MKCINCYREIKNSVKFCTYCGTKQPANRAAYELEHPELAEAMPEDEVNFLINQQQQGPNVIDITPPEDNDHMDNNAMPPLEYGATPAMPQDSYMPPQQAMPPTGGNLVSAPQNPVPMTQCQECGQMVPVNAHMCPYCGAPLHQAHYQNETTQMVVPSVAPVAPRPSIAPVPPTSSDGGGTKKALIIIAAVLGVGILGLLAFYLFQKNKATYLTPDTNELFFSRKGGDKVVKVSTDGNDFDISDHPDWLTVNKSGEGITVNCASRDANDDRTGTITLTSGRITTRVNVTQRAYATFIKLSETTIQQGKGEGDHVISIDSDGGGFSYTAPDYCTVNNLTDQSFSLHINSNSGKHRDGVVKITDGKNVGVLTISQKGVCSSCGGDGKVTCPECYGDGWDYYYDYLCYKCNGDGTVKCSKCGGSGIR